MKGEIHEFTSSVQELESDVSTQVVAEFAAGSVHLDPASRSLSTPGNRTRLRRLCSLCGLPYVVALA